MLGHLEIIMPGVMGLFIATLMVCIWPGDFKEHMHVKAVCHDNVYHKTIIKQEYK